ncbi:MAG: type I 3-dehydroquinate dehydratase [Chthoniobacteraceae bacterium]
MIKPGAIVGTVHSPASLRVAVRIAAGAVDFLELRVDHFAEETAPLLKAAVRFAPPLIVTVRHPAEGGQHELTFARRRSLYAQFLPHAAAIDVELRSIRALAGVLEQARAHRVCTIVSFHDFRATPSAARLRDIVRRAVAAGADVVKIATRADTCRDLHRLLGLFTTKAARPLSVMAMGQYGKVSRLLFAQAGSVLNYAYFGTANASGQWSVAEFRRRLAELSS